MGLFQIFLFLLIHSTHNFSFACKDTERATLLQFKHNFNYTCESSVSSWVVGKDCCSWSGVSCDNITGNVIKLDIDEGWRFKAVKVNTSPLDLPYLQHLDLSFIEFNWATIPNFFGSLGQLQFLNLSWNNALEKDILHHLANLTTLFHLDLAYSCKYGAIERNDMGAVLKLVNLKTLDMRGLNLSQSTNVLDVLHKFPSLSKLVLSGCQLGNSHLPIINSNLSSIEYLDLSQNSITGSIPRAVCRLINLRVLDLQKNRLSGVILDCLGSIDEIRVLDLSSNELSGSIPTSLLKVDTLRLLRLYNNSLEGELPRSLKSVSMEVLDVSKNYLTGEIPLWNGTNAPFLHILVLRENRFTGAIPPHLCSLNRLQVIDLGNNNFTGTIPLCFGDFKSMMDSTSQTSKDFNGFRSTLISYPNEGSLVEVILRHIYAHFLCKKWRLLSAYMMQMS